MAPILPSFFLDYPVGQITCLVGFPNLAAKLLSEEDTTKSVFRIESSIEEQWWIRNELWSCIELPQALNMKM